MAGNGKTFHLHIDNSTQLGDVFDITEQRLSDAVKRHADIAGNVRITVGRDGEGFNDAMATADVLFAWNFDRSDLAAVAPNLRWIQVQGAGVNHLTPFDWIPPGVTVTNCSGAHGDSTRSGPDYG